MGIYKGMTMKTKINKVENPESYIGLPVSNTFVNGLTRDGQVRNVGCITGVVEVDGMHELTIEINDAIIISNLIQSNTPSFEIH